MSNEELVKQIQQGSNADVNIEELYHQNKGIIKRIIKNYSYVYQVKNSKASVPIIEFQDLMNEAYFGLIEAAKRYDDTVGAKFMSYAPFWIKQSIQRYIENNYRSVRMPVGLQGRIFQYKKIINAYKLQLHRKPTDDELCICLRIEFKALNELRKAYHRYNQINSLDKQLQDEEGLSLGDTVQGDTDVENSVINNTMDESLKTELWQIVKENTTEEENEVIHCRYKKDLSLQATGEITGQTKDKVRSLEAKALRHLRKNNIRRKLEEKFEINYAKSYRTSFTSWKNTGESTPERLAIENVEIELKIIRLILDTSRDNVNLLSTKQLMLAKEYHIV